MATFTVEEQLDLLIKKLFYGVAKGGPSDNYNFTNESVDSFLAVKPSDIWTNAASIPTTPPTTTNSNVEVYIPNAGEDQNAPLQLTAVTGSQNAGNYTDFRKQWVALDSSSNRLKNWIGPGYGAGYAVRVFVGQSGWTGTDATIATKGIQEISFGSNAAADWFFDYEAGVLLWTNENLNEGVAGDFQQSVDFTTTTSLIANGDVVYIKAQRYVGGTGLGSATNVTVADSSDDTAFPLVFTDGASSSASLKIDSASPPTYNPSTNVLSTGALTASVSFSTGSLNVNGDTTLGDAITDAINLTARFNSNLLPISDNSKDLGSALLKWSDVYATTFTGALVGNADTATKIASITNTNIVQLTATQTLTNKTLTDPTITGTGAIAGVFTGDLTGTADLAADIAGGALGDVLYQNGSGDTAFLNGNNTTTRKFLLSVGDGTNAAAPTFATLTATDVGLGSVTNASQATIVAAAEASAANLYLPLAGGTISSNLTISGNLTVGGTVSQTNSQEVNFNDTRLRLNVPTGLMDGGIEDTAAPSGSVNVGLEVFNGASASALSNGPLWVYNYSTDHWGASIQGSETTLDNVAALKFDVTDTNSQQDQANGTTTMAAAHEANASSVRSLGAVAKCSITITTDGANVGTNYAPAEAGAVGYPIKHNLATQSVFAVAIQTVDSAGNTLADPQPVYCKYIPEDDNTVRVSVGVTQGQEQYDIIVIG